MSNVSAMRAALEAMVSKNHATEISSGVFTFITDMKYRNMGDVSPKFGKITTAETKFTFDFTNEAKPIFHLDTVLNRGLDTEVIIPTTSWSDVLTDHDVEVFTTFFKVGSLRMGDTVAIEDPHLLLTVFGNGENAPFFKA